MKIFICSFLILFVHCTFAAHVDAEKEVNSLVILGNYFNKPYKQKPYAARAALGFHKDLGRVVYFYDGNGNQILYGMYQGSNAQLAHEDVMRFSSWIDQGSLQKLRDIPDGLQPFEIMYIPKRISPKIKPKKSPTF